MSAIDCTLELARYEDARKISTMSAQLIETGLPISWDVARVTRYIRDRESVALVARYDVELAGFAIMRYAEETAHLNLLAVHPAFQRLGIGSRLLRWLEETAVVAGTFEISLEVRTDNDDAMAFYAALGYREAGRVRGYYSGMIDAARLVRDLRVAEAGPPLG